VNSEWLQRTIISSLHGRIIVWWVVILLAVIVLKPRESQQVVLRKYRVKSEEPQRFAMADSVSVGVVEKVARETFATVADSKGSDRSKKVPMPFVAIDINRADKEQMCTIKGVGPVLALRIIEYRNAHGPFSSVDELSQVKGIGAKTVEKLKNQKVWAGK